MDALANIGINGKLLLAQAVNFLLVLYILKRFAYKPMLEFLDKRTARIEQGIKDAENANRKLVEIEKREKEILRTAHEEGKSIVARAEEAARIRGKATVEEIEGKAEAILAEAKKAAMFEREQMLRDVKDEISETVLAAVEKILKEKVDTEKDRALIKQMMDEN